MVERMDQGIGSILNALRDNGLAGNTLVIFMSDNGAANVGRNAPFSGNKGNVFEGGIRVPCAVQWPGVLPQGVISDQAVYDDGFLPIHHPGGGGPSPTGL